MTLIRKTQVGLLITAVVLFVLLFLAPKTNPEKETKDKVTSSASEKVLSLETFITMASKSLKPEVKATYDDLLAKAKSSQVDTAFVSVVQFWDKQKRPDFAAYFVEQIAERKNTSIAYSKAGDRYYYSVRFTKDNNEIPTLYQSAIRCYEKAIEKDDKNIDAKIQLAACFVEDGKDPMKGIGLLRDVEKTDSNNVKLQLTFAFFSVKSQQWDKAIKRFEKVLSIDPLYIEAYLHLADAYEQQGQKGKTIEMLEKYAGVTEDAMAKQEVLKYIEQLKK
ncbi:MAG: tetratricopeptide repeat protein [Burkholderiales bacterium]|nr:tetratricopeptide repeat protein [Bacteroidia bacterium]